MAYTSGDLILDDHYNTFATGSATGAATDSANVNNLWGVGYGDRGYGQSTTLAAVSAGTTITATQWATMLSRISSMASHTGATITAISNPTVGDTITAYTALSNNIQAVYNLRTNNFSGGTTSQYNVQGTGSWSTSTVHEFTVTFASANAARYYFNCGGRIRLDTDISGGTSDAKYNEWVDLSNTLAGSIYFKANGSSKLGGLGTPTTLETTIGYYDLTSTYQTIYLQYADSSPYTSNYIRIQAKVSGTAQNGGPGETITFEVRYQDDSADSTFDKAVYTPEDVMDGTVTSYLELYPPGTSYVSNTWGTITVGSTSTQS